MKGVKYPKHRRIFKNEKFTNTKILIGKVDENMSWIGAISQLFGIKA